MESDGAGNLKALSDAKENFDLTQKQRSADVEYLRNLKLTCDDLDAQWAKRSQNRAAEMKAVSETLVILTEDDNHEQLRREVCHCCRPSQPQHCDTAVLWQSRLCADHPSSHLS